MTKTEAIELVQKDFENVISYSQNFCCDLDSDAILEQWYDNKKEFIDAMGDLIYEINTPISFELSADEQRKKIDNFLKTIRTVYHNEDLSWFLNKNRNGFFSNYVVEDYEYNGKKIPRGMKLVKAFKFFFNDPVITDMAQSEASRIIQENKVEGILCFSVHPLDFLSSSENTHNWRSCHALDGEFRAGNLSYMCDNATVICYLKSKNEDKVRLPAFPPTIPWNSKKWRMLMYVNTTRNALFAGRQYPFFCENALATLKPYFVEALQLEGHPTRWSHWHDDTIERFEYSSGYDNEYTRTNNRAIVMDNYIHVIDKFVKDLSNLHFNDVLKSSCYDPFYCWYRTEWGDKMVKMFKIGSKPKCPVCGGEEISHSDCMCCSPCFDRYYSHDDYEESIGECSCCGHLLYENDSYSYANGQWDSDLLVCEECAEEECALCSCCGGLMFKDYLVLDPETKEMICGECFEDKYPKGVKTSAPPAEEEEATTPPPRQFTIEDIQMPESLDRLQLSLERIALWDQPLPGQFTVENWDWEPGDETELPF